MGKGILPFESSLADVMHIKEVSSFLVKGELPSMVDLLPTFMGSSRLTIHSGRTYDVLLQMHDMS